MPCAGELAAAAGRSRPWRRRRRRGSARRAAAAAARSAASGRTRPSAGCRRTACRPASCSRPNFSRSRSAIRTRRARAPSAARSRRAARTTARLRDDGVRQDRVEEDEAGRAPVLRDEPDRRRAARARGRARRRIALPCRTIRPVRRPAGRDAVQGLEQFGAARAEQAGQADDLAGADGQGDAVGVAAAGAGAAGLHGEVVDAGASSSPASASGVVNMVCTGRPTIASTISRGLSVARVEAGRRTAPLRRTVARSATVRDLLHPVGDVDDADAAARAARG